jgi:alkanesulfonate monooxygenase SsuD/methylene tetrahydromethanopterin reductase-like flavin-dependent oxidoreductase (luciferase family)
MVLRRIPVSAIKFGWIAPAIGPPESNHEPLVMYQQREILPVAVQHFDSLWVCDHFYGFERRSDPFVEGWTALTWLAAKYPNVMVGHHVLGLGYRNPALTGKMAATLQTMSGGRFILAIGAGWRGEEYAAYGYDFPRPAVRIAQLEDAVQLMRIMWTDDNPTFTGKHFQIASAYAPPHPEPIPPILIGGSGEQLMLPLVGRRADMWNTSAGRGVETFIRKRDIVHRSAEAFGRDPGAITLTVTREAPLPQTSDDSAKWVEALEEFKREGVTHFLCDFGHVTETEPVLRFAEEVIKPLKG